MASASAVGEWTGDGLVHAALLYNSDDELSQRVLPFAEQALTSDQPLVVVGGDRVRAVLEDAFGPGTERFAAVVDADAQWAGGPQTISWYQSSLAPLLATGRPWRLIAEPTWLARPGGEVWSRYDAVANELFATYPCYALCVGDLRSLPPHLAEDFLRVHPLVWDGSRSVASPVYQPAGDFLRSVEPAWSQAPEQRHDETVTHVAEARSFVRAALPEGVSESRADDVVLAVHELVANALKVAGTAEISQWREGGAVVWEVRDSGPGLHDTTAGYLPPAQDLSGGRGLWLARSLADETVVRPDGPGTAIRLYFSAP